MNLRALPDGHLKQERKALVQERKNAEALGWPLAEIQTIEDSIMKCRREEQRRRMARLREKRRAEACQ